MTLSLQMSRPVLRLNNVLCIKKLLSEQIGLLRKELVNFANLKFGPKEKIGLQKLPLRTNRKRQQGSACCRFRDVKIVYCPSNRVENSARRAGSVLHMYPNGEMGTWFLKKFFIFSCAFSGVYSPGAQLYHNLWLAGGNLHNW